MKNLYLLNLRRCLGRLFILLIASCLLQVSSAWAQSRTIAGQVTDLDSDEALPGVNIVVKGTTTGTVTDVDGNYRLTVSQNAESLVFSSVGYAQEEVEIGNQSTINVQLAPDIQNLSEVVVVGYGTERKEDLTGAVSLVDPEEMVKQATNDVMQMMQGRVAGVAITSDGQPGAAPSVRIRGVSTFGSGGASAEPLYVVDGFPLSGGIRDINPNDIESIQVLKDATAGAIYGNRASNGVVIITTKSGRKGQDFTVGFNAYYGIQTIPQRIPLLGRVGYQAINTELLANGGLPPVPGNDPNSPDFIDDVDTDWQDAGFKDGKIANYNVNFAGGTEKTSYYISLDYLDNEGTLVGSGPDYKRYSFRVNSETQVGRVKFGENVYVVRSDENPLLFTTDLNLPGSRPTLVNDLLQAAPTIPLYDENREGGFGGADGVIHQSITLNVPGINSLVQNSTMVNRILANLYGEIELLEGLSYKLNLQYDNSDITDERFVPQYNLGYFFPNPNATYAVNDRSSNSFLVENTLNYVKTFGKHDLKLLVGQTYQDFNFRGVNAVGTGLEKPYILNLGNAETVNVSDNIQNSAIASLLGRINYAYDDRYLLTFNVRRDGSSKFREDNRFDIFPSIGLAWKIHNDFQLPEFISDLKLRGGYGQLGNQNINNYAYQRVINRAIPYEFGGGRVLGAANTIVVDPTIRWESKTTRNVALDAVLWDGRLEFTAEYYSNTSEDVLLGLPIPRSVGSLGDGIITNAASIKNSGIELSASYRQNLGDLTLDIAPNFYTVRNEVLDLGGILSNITGTGARSIVGQPIGRHYGWVFDGIFQTEEEVDNHAFQNDQTSPGDVRFRDLNEDGQITDDDRDFLGNGMPTFYYGLNLVANYKNFDLTVFASGSGGNLINSNFYRGLMTTSGFTNWHEDILNRWTAENPSREYSRVVFNDPNLNNRDSDRPNWLQKGDYLRINTISLGYNIPADLLSRVKMKSARIYATIQNVHTFTAYKGFNPDFQAGILNPGFDFGTFPRPRTTMFGVQIKF
ncbi:SusC/RagA family TonB-linked outer membrane protein [Catalinimonas niigatensis]|uniref:SusC/RagA family TonB-linked outer membrane protein n=1 Tax=Catalinimonas niigatensis TaxID=1397264 RepID=UPI002664F8BC|nr:TonB-dependent receptor [Catalinimonas niigatensis]WPP52111.1 TonB-dependent receptor [Catalinimonas niigatensis]